jgi:hypothetical protein
MAEDEEQSGRGRIGVEIFEQVEKIVAEEGINRTEAFQRISGETGRRPGTVAANYYRVARQRGADLQTRGGRGRRRARTRAASSSDVEAVLSRISAAMNELSELVRSQERELNRLREQSEQLHKVRRLLAD